MPNSPELSQIHHSRPSRPDPAQMTLIFAGRIFRRPRQENGPGSRVTNDSMTHRCEPGSPGSLFTAARTHEWTCRRYCSIWPQRAAARQPPPMSSAATAHASQSGAAGSRTLAALAIRMEVQDPGHRTRRPGCPQAHGGRNRAHDWSPARTHRVRPQPRTEDSPGSSGSEWPCPARI
jgi:hypothetical protein